MKKFFLIAAAAIAVLASCSKNNETKHEITLTSSEVVDLGDGNFTTIKFNSTDPWTAILADANGEKPSFVKADILSGPAGAGEIKLTVEDLPEDVTGRAFFVALETNISPEDAATALVTVIQGKVFFAKALPLDKVSKGGGKLEFKVITNCTDYTIKTYDAPDQAYPWAPVTFDKATGNLAFDVAANDGFDSRSAYAKFTVNDIQVPEINEETGEPTGSTVPYVYKVYIYQEGYMTTEWNTPFTENIALASTHSIAKFGDKVYVANALAGSSLFVFDAKTGAAEGTLALTAINENHVNSITCDDAGNLLIAFGGECGGAFDVYRVNEGKTISKENATKIIGYANGFYGYGFDRIKATGNATASAAISVVSAVGYDGGSYVVSWQITGGTCDKADSYSGCAILPTGAAVWYSGDMVAQHTTADINGGVMYMGYDAHYDICYNPSLNGEWAHIHPAAVTYWGENLSGMDMVEWDSSKYVVYVANTFFPEWAMASYIGILDVTKQEPKLISLSEHYNEGGVLFGSTDSPNERTADVCAVVEGGSLVLYVVDGGNAYIKKLSYPFDCPAHL